jgi:TIR domain
VPADTPAAFFSYSRHDSEFALRLAADLKAAGAAVWMDQLDIPRGQRWDRAVQNALTNCPRMLVILSPSSVDSENVLDEIDLALEKHKTVIPVFYRDCEKPLRLRRVEHIDFRNDYDRGLKVLLKDLGVEQAMAASATAAPATPKEAHLALTDTTVRRIDEQVKLEVARLVAAEKARLEQEERERQAAAEKARLEEEQRRSAAEKARLEQEERERQGAAEKARLKAEQRRAAAEKARLEQEERERQAAAEKARLEEEQRRAAAEKARLEQEERERQAAAEALVEKAVLEEVQRRADAEKARLEQEERVRRAFAGKSAQPSELESAVEIALRRTSRQAAGHSRFEEEKKQADEQAQLEEAWERIEQARLERQRVEQGRLEEQRRQGSSLGSIMARLSRPAPGQPMTAAGPTAFFSYSRQDFDFALRLAKDLKDAGANVWIDQLDIQPGMPWDGAVDDALAKCPLMLVILSPDAVKSNKVNDEISFALRKGKSLLPVLYQDCMVPLQLRRVQHIDFRNDYAQGLADLLKALA